MNTFDLSLWTVRAAVGLYAATLALLLARSRRDRLARAGWTVGCALLWVHVGLAFHAVHHWDHGHAVRHTADQTARLVGVRSGAGVYLNYLFVLAWAADAAYWWRVGHDRYRRRRRAVGFAVHAFLAFIVFNATVVFAAGPTRFVGAAVTVGLVGLVVWQRWRADP